jgi:hypothetical protein
MENFDIDDVKETTLVVVIGMAFVTIMLLMIFLDWQ